MEAIVKTDFNFPGQTGHYVKLFSAFNFSFLFVLTTLMIFFTA